MDEVYLPGEFSKGAILSKVQSAPLHELCFERVSVPEEIVSEINERSIQLNAVDVLRRSAIGH